MPPTKRKREDLVQLGKAIGRIKLSFTTKSKLIDEVS